MSTRPRRPVRRLPARVYWVRRTLVLGLVLLLGWSLLGLASSDGEAPSAGDEEAASGTDADTASAAETVARRLARAGRSVLAERTAEKETRRPSLPDTAEGPGEGLSAGGNGRPSPVVAPLGQATTACDPPSVQVAPAVTGEPVAGRPLQVGLTLGTSSDKPCRLDLDPELLLLQVSAPDDDAVWDSARCPATMPVPTVSLTPGWLTTVAVSWPVTLLDRRCAGLTRPAPGSYAVQSAVLGGEPASASFVVTAPRRPEPDRATDAAGAAEGDATTAGAGDPQT